MPWPKVKPWAIEDKALLPGWCRSADPKDLKSSAHWDWGDADLSKGPKAEWNKKKKRPVLRRRRSVLGTYKSAYTPQGKKGS